MRYGNFQIWFTIFFVSLVRSRLRQNSTPPYPAMKLSFLKNFIFESCCHNTVLNLKQKNDFQHARHQYGDIDIGGTVFIMCSWLWVTVVLLCPGYVVLKFDHTHEKQGTALYYCEGNFYSTAPKSLKLSTWSNGWFTIATNHLLKDWVKAVERRELCTFRKMAVQVAQILLNF